VPARRCGPLFSQDGRPAKSEGGYKTSQTSRKSILNPVEKGVIIRPKRSKHHLEEDVLYAAREPLFTICGKPVWMFQPLGGCKASEMKGIGHGSLGGVYAQRLCRVRNRKYSFGAV